MEPYTGIPKAAAKGGDDDWSPYSENGGTVVALAGKDFVIIAGDTRLISSYDILTRNASKLVKLTDNAILGSTGCFTDVLTLQKVLAYHIKNYSFDHDEEITTLKLANLLSTILYSKRFFPYYVANILAGLDDNGHGYIALYDSVGSYELLTYGVVGSGQNLIIPYMDSCIPKKNRNEPVVEFSYEESLNIIKDCFTIAGERHMAVGDDVEILTIRKEGIEREIFKLKRD